ncbi:MAG: ABC transporter ATP-binding protein/permease [Eubacterium sp.]|nr:ABC transporter ATP-binding protein/permease [Eubacterium sp.]
MKKLLKYLTAYKLRAVLAPVFKMLEACFELMVPLVIAKLIDDGITKNSSTTIYMCGAILIGLTIVGYGASLTAQYFAAKAALGFGKELRNDLFRIINGLTYTDIDKVGSSTLITRMTSDVNLVVTGVNMFLRLFLRSPFIVFGAVIMAFTVDAHVSMVFLVIMPLLAFVVCFITYACIPLYRKVQEKLDRVTLLTREGLIGIRVIRAFNREEIEKKEFAEGTDDLQGAQMKVGRLSALMNPVTYLIVNIGILMLIYFGGIRVDAGDLSQGQVVALVNYMSQVLVELVKLANLIITLTKALASARRLSDIISLEDKDETKASSRDKSGSAKKDSYGSDGPSLIFDNVSMSYEGSRENAIEDITFSAKAGDIIGIIGGTGSGKSTLVNLIPGFYHITAGSLMVDGREVNSYDKEELRSKIGIVPQKSVLFKGSIKDNLHMSAPDANTNTMNKALEVSQSAEFVNLKPEKLDYELTQGGKNLSGGQRQRLCIARALVREPEILILDDSSSALDYATEAKLRVALEETRDSRITIIVSQRASSIINADKILVLDDGKCIGMGRHDELMDSCEIYREIYHTQFSEKGGVSA